MEHNQLNSFILGINAITSLVIINTLNAITNQIQETHDIKQ